MKNKRSEEVTYEQDSNTESSNNYTEQQPKMAMTTILTEDMSLNQMKSSGSGQKRNLQRANNNYNKKESTGKTYLNRNLVKKKTLNTEDLNYKDYNLMPLDLEVGKELD